MAFRVFLAGMFHETHSFMAAPTDEAVFRSGIGKWQIGDEILERNRGDASCMGGAIAMADEAGWELVPSVYIAAAPGGMVAQSVMDGFMATLMADLTREIDSIDGIFLVLHGAAMSEAWEDVEGEILTRVRAACEATGRRIPLCGVLDLHANLTATMGEQSDYLRAYRKNPHTDSRETTIASARFLDRLMREPELTTYRHFLHPPLMFSPRGTGTVDDPMKSVLARALEHEAADPRIACINVIAGYAYADMPSTGFALSLVATDPAVDGAAVLQDLADLAYTLREHGHPQDEPVDAVLASISPDDPGPVVLAEPSDNIGGGTPGDGTGLLQAMLRSGLPRCVVVIADPESAAACHAAGVGATVDLRVGGKTDRHHGDPVPLTAEVLHLSDGRFDLEDPHSHLASMTGLHVRMGDSATVRAGNVTILLTSNKVPPFDLGQLRSQGIEPCDALVIGAKAAVGHRQAYRPIAAREASVDTPGLGTSNLPTLPYKRLTRPIFPLDDV